MMIKNIFHSEQYLGKHKNDYFEGWYFRHAGSNPFSFIAGISKNKSEKHSFIQYIDTACSFYFKFSIDDFVFNKKDMTVSVAGNMFSLNGINVNICRDGQSIFTDIKYSGVKLYKKNIYAPSVMGPFSYLPMFCAHSVISLRHNTVGILQINNAIREVNCTGYIEKDFGRKFPDNYCWMHATTDNISIMAAVAWPLAFKMKGFLCVILYKEKQYNFSLYTGAKLDFEADENRVMMRFKKKNNALYLELKNSSFAQKLIAPVGNGQMSKEIYENLAAKCKAHLILNGEAIDLTHVAECAYEVVLNDL